MVGVLSKRLALDDAELDCQPGKIWEELWRTTIPAVDLGLVQKGSAVNLPTERDACNYNPTCCMLCLKQQTTGTTACKKTSKWILFLIKPDIRDQA